MKVHRSMQMLIVVGLMLVFTPVFSQQGIAASDPSIQDWGTPPGTPPPWQTHDVWVDNNGNGIINEVGEPSKGAVNRLLGKIRNLGTTAASNVTVRFLYAPFGAWGWSSYSDFKEIAVVSGVTLGAAGAPDAEKLIEVQWDLRDLSENNGGNWGGYSVGDFDHFCVWVRIECATDSNPGNNDARNNFTNVETVSGEPYKLKFLVSNPGKERANAELIIRGLPENWKSRLSGIDDAKRFVLKPKEYRMVSLTITPPKEMKADQISRPVDIGLKLDNETVGGISFAATVTKEAKTPFTPADGVLSPYIIGTYDNRDDLETIMQIVNPTGRNLRLLIALFDDNEKPLKCIREKLSPNDMVEIPVRGLRLPAKIGVVKVVSLNAREEIPEPGIVGYKRNYLRRALVSETVLHPIPTPVLKEDLPYIMRGCK